MEMPRIVSLLPAATEIACALGLEEALVGRSHECDHPPGVASLPVCTRTRLEDGPSRILDDRVRDLVSRGLSLYEVDATRLRSLRPEVILTQDQCAVCAASPDDLASALADWLGGAPRVVSLRPETLGDVWDDLVRVGEATGREERARAVASELASRVTEVGEQSGDLPRPRVACLEWLDPPMGAGNWIPELVHLAGGEPLFGATGAHSAPLSWEALAEADPEVLVLSPCGFDLDRCEVEAAALRSRPELRSLRALAAGRVAATDANAHFTRPGPRLAQTAEVLAEILHPERFDFGHRGRFWRPFAL